MTAIDGARQTHRHTEVVMNAPSDWTFQKMSGHVIHHGQLNNHCGKKCWSAANLAFPGRFFNQISRAPALTSIKLPSITFLK